MGGCPYLWWFLPSIPSPPRFLGRQTFPKDLSPPPSHWVLLPLPWILSRDLPKSKISFPLPFFKPMLGQHPHWVLSEACLFSYWGCFTFSVKSEMRPSPGKAMVTTIKMSHLNFLTTTSPV